MIGQVFSYLGVATILVFLATAPPVRAADPTGATSNSDEQLKPDATTVECKRILAKIELASAPDLANRSPEFRNAAALRAALAASNQDELPKGVKDARPILLLLLDFHQKKLAQWRLDELVDAINTFKTWSQQRDVDDLVIHSVAAQLRQDNRSDDAEQLLSRFELTASEPSNANEPLNGLVELVGSRMQRNLQRSVPAYKPPSTLPKTTCGDDDDSLKCELRRRLETALQRKLTDDEFTQIWEQWLSGQGISEILRQLKSASK